MSELKNIEDRLSALEESLKKQSKRFSWEDKSSETGIQLAAGPTTFTRYGTLLTAAPIPVGPGQLTIALVLMEDSTGKIYVMPVEAAKPL